MITRRLGKSDITVSAIGMGCWAIGGPWTWQQPGEDGYPAGWGHTDDDASIRAVHAAIDAGITLFDTAANYGAGHSEIVLGKALQGKRDAVIIATKFGHVINEDTKIVYGDQDVLIENVRQDVENSLRRLDTDCIDLFQLHEAELEDDKAVKLIDILEDLVKQGKIRWYGWSTDVVVKAKLWAEAPHCTSIQFRMNTVYDNQDMRNLLASADWAGLNKDPLNKGILTGKFTKESTFPDDDIRSRADFGSGPLLTRLHTVEQLRPIFTSSGRTMAQGALAYILGLDDRLIPIPGAKTLQQIQDNAGVLELGAMTTDEIAQVCEIVEANEPEIVAQQSR